MSGFRLFRLEPPSLRLVCGSGGFGDEHMLAGCRVLIVEDEALVACDLAYSVEAAHGQVVGPFATVEEGMFYLEQEDVHGAILDIQLADGNIEPLAIALLDRGWPVVFHTASAVPTQITSRQGKQSVCPKPQSADKVILQLAKAMGREIYTAISHS